MNKVTLTANRVSRDPMSTFVSCMVFLTAAMTLSVPSGYSYGTTLLCLAAIVLLFKERTWKVLEREDWWLFGTFTLYFVINVATRIYHGYPGSVTTNSNRFFLGALILPLLLKYPLRPAFLWAGLIVGCVSGFLLAIWQTSILGLGRAHGYVHPIQFGDISILMGFLCLTGLIWAHRSHRHIWFKIALLIGALAGVGASILSGSRGGWLLLPIFPIVFGFIYRKQLSAKAMAVPALGVIIVVAALLVMPSTHIEQRVAAATNQVQLFLNGKAQTSSVGARLTMWTNALKIIPEKPMLGWGEVDYAEPMVSQIEKPNVRRAISQYGHVHNEILDATAKRGLIGLFALLAIYLVPFVLFWRHLRRDRTNPFILGGVATVLGFFVFGWTETMFVHNNSNIVYVFYIIVFWACARNTAFHMKP